MRTFIYPASLRTDHDGSYTVRFRDLPEAITGNRNRAQALAQAPDCLEEAVASRIADSEEIPEPSAARARDVLIPLPAPMAAKAALYLAIRQAGMSNVELARRLKIQEGEIRRMLNPRHPTKIVRIHTILQALGKRLLVSMDTAA